MIHKAYAYVVRQHNNTQQLLVFKHQQIPAAGVQVPKGTVEPGEEWAEAVLREVEEETGLRATIQRFLTSDYIEQDGQLVNRHFYMLTVEEERSEWLHYPTGHLEKGLTFHCYWIDKQQLSIIYPAMADYAYLVFN